MRPIRHTAYVFTMIALAGCSKPFAGNAAPAPRAAVASNTVTSEIVSGTREKGPYAGSWSVHIEVRVRAFGPAFGYTQTTYLNLEGSTLVDDRTTWLNFNSDGWPDSYKVEARYESWTESSAEVTVEVKVDDVRHRAFGEVVYRARHPIQWEEATKP